MSPPIPAELLTTFAELGRLYPNMRFGQLLEMIALLSSDDVPQTLAGVQDEMLLGTAVAHRLHRLNQLGVESARLLQRPISAARHDLFEVLEELHKRQPDSQIGQLVTHLAERSGASLYDAEDEDLLAVAEEQLRCGTVSRPRHR